MREGDLPGMHDAVPPAAHRDRSRRVVRRAEGPLGYDALLPQRAGDRMNLGDLQRLRKGEVGHDGGDAAREHGLARAGRPHEQQIVSARDGDFERPARDGLSLDELQIGALPRVHMRDKRFGRERRDCLRAQQKAYRLRKRGDGIDLCAAQKGGLFCVPGGNNEARIAVRPCGDEDGQQPRDGAHRAVEGELAQKYRTLRIRPDELLARLEEAHRHREVERRALLLSVRRGEIDGDLPHREGETAVLDGGAHALARLLDGGVGKPHHLIGGDAAGDIRLHFHGDALQPLQRITDDFCDHIPPFPVPARRIPRKIRQPKRYAMMPEATGSPAANTK